MNIEQARLDWGHMPVKLVFSYGKVDTFPFTIVRLSAAGHTGLGEVIVPHNAFLETLLGNLVGADARRLDALLPVTESDHDRIMCEAVSIALYDLVGKLSGLALHALLGGAPDLRVPLMPCIFPNNGDEARDSAAKWFDQGYRFLKVKLIGDLDDDLSRVTGIRAVAPDGVVLQGDANCGYTTLDDAARAVAELGAAGLDIFEDPLKGGVDDYAQLTRRRGEGDAKIMVDLLSRRTDDLAAVLRSGACNVIGIHPDQPGSLSRALLHARMAQAMDVPVVIGGTGFTGVSTAAYQHLTAVATPGGPAGELGGFFDHGMPRNMVKEPLAMNNGRVELTNAPGMGTEIDEETLNTYREGFKQWPK